MVSFVVIEYHSIDEIKRCIKSIETNCKDINYELIVSSNSCYPQWKQDEIKKEISSVIWQFNKKNGGFGYGMNQGLRRASGDYLIIMNPDVILKDSLIGLVNFLETHKNIGAIAPQIINENGIIQDSCRKYMSLPSFIIRQLRRLHSHNEALLEKNFDYSLVQTVDWVIGAFIMVPKSIFVSTNGLCEDYFMYVEDEDWCTRIRLLGYEIVYYPKIRIQYQGTRSARKNSNSAKIFITSLITYWRKYGFFYGYPKRKSIKYTER